jgi:hypothetical protein
LLIRFIFSFSTTFVRVKQCAPTLTTFVHESLVLEKPFHH